MALALKFSICQASNCKDYTFKELTGTYSSLNNPSGYGTPNIDTTAVTKAKLTITNPLGIVTNIDLHAVGFPVKDLTLSGYLVTSLNTLIDGEYKFVYEITIPATPTVTIPATPSMIIPGDPSVFVPGTPEIIVPGTPEMIYTKTIYEYFFCNSECCVTKMLPYVESCDCCKDNISQKNYITTWSMLESLKKAAQCGDSTVFASILKIITKLCLNSACKTCK